MKNFSKWQGLGNDFVIVVVEPGGDMDMAGSAERVCDRHFGIGADGLVPIRARGGNEFDMRIFNADGTEAEMCGNVTRCVARHIKKYGLSEAEEYILHTKAGRIKAQVRNDGRVRVDMGEPRLSRKDIPVSGPPEERAVEMAVEAEGELFSGTAVSMGNPHFVVFVPQVSEIMLEDSGAHLERSPLFPKRANIEFAEVLDRETIRMRVWERGCGVTMACGTGACATAVAGYLTGRTGERVRVILDGGELLIEYDQDDKHVYMTGPAEEVFTGTLLINE